MDAACRESIQGSATAELSTWALPFYVILEFQRARSSVAIPCMAPRILLGLGAILYAGWNVFSAWRSDTLDDVPGYRFFIWGAMIAVGVTLILRALRAGSHSRA